MLFDGLIEENEKRESQLIAKAKSLAKFKQQLQQQKQGNSINDSISTNESASN